MDSKPIPLVHSIQTCLQIKNLIPFPLTIRSKGQSLWWEQNQKSWSSFLESNSIKVGRTFHCNFSFFFFLVQTSYHLIINEKYSQEYNWQFGINISTLPKKIIFDYYISSDSDYGCGFTHGFKYVQNLRLNELKPKHYFYSQN